MRQSLHFMRQKFTFYIVQIFGLEQDHHGTMSRERYKKSTIRTKAECLRLKTLSEAVSPLVVRTNSNHRGFHRARK